MNKRALRLLTSIALAFTALATSPAASAEFAAPSGPSVTPSPIPRDDPSRGLVHQGLLPDQNNLCHGSLRLRTSGCTHGPDPAPPGMNVKRRVKPLATASAAAAECVGDGTSGNRVQVMYVHPPGVDRFANYQASFKQWALDMDTIYNESAKETGGTRHIRFVQDAACMPVVLNVTISANALANFDATINALRGLNYNRTDRSYSLLTESTVYCGIGQFDGDDRKGSGNRSNVGPSFARVDSGCWGGSVMAHELGHNLGAVNNNAPNASGGAHCTDEYDVMCYSDAPRYPAMRYICGDRAHENRLDCKHDDYFSTNPPAGSYLATHWNVADSTFLTSGGPQPPARVGPIVGVPSKRCLEAPSPADLTQIVLNDCNEGTGQKWTVDTDGTIRAQGKCLDVRAGSSAAGTVVELYSCGGGANQQWTYDPATKNLKSLGQCLDASGGATGNGTELIIWPCHTGTNQQWNLPS
ncbi:ricin-type beta-trefoil lectin domain protein [Actinomadura rayongensis]|uniref:Hydrolase n=1 Tax=Actinomadura rayongensis TaxID=1429076 RepID=A0A6I4VX85_9ACTN|nr:ricin-type beta-trefoil lectin domain protein [Actinomadura rayongensis]MXQ62547.1 hydrolase [Actinomadura rayongensis]